MNENKVRDYQDTVSRMLVQAHKSPSQFDSCKFTLLFDKVMKMKRDLK